MEKWSVWFDDLPVETGGFPLQTLKFAEGINAWSVFSLLLLFLFQPVDHSTSTRKHIYILLYIYIYYIIYILYYIYIIYYILYILYIYIPPWKRHWIYVSSISLLYSTVSMGQAVRPGGPVNTLLHSECAAVNSGRSTEKSSPRRPSYPSISQLEACSFRWSISFKSSCSTSSRGHHG